MKKVVLAPAVEIAMRTLDPDGVRRVHAWFSYLERWDTDEVVRRNSEQLQEMPGVYVMRTTTDIRILNETASRWAKSGIPGFLTALSSAPGRFFDSASLVSYPGAPTSPQPRSRVRFAPSS